jgi:hypothetical protein
VSGRAVLDVEQVRAVLVEPEGDHGGAHHLAVDRVGQRRQGGRLALVGDGHDDDIGGLGDGQVLTGDQQVLGSPALDESVTRFVGALLPREPRWTG